MICGLAQNPVLIKTTLEPGIQTRDPPLIRGSIYEKKMIQDQDLNRCTAATIQKKVLSPR